MLIFTDEGDDFQVTSEKSADFVRLEKCVAAGSMAMWHKAKFDFM